MEDISWPLDTIEPREVQLAALRAGYGKPGYAYFLRQRLGKSWLAYAEYKLLKEEDLVDWIVIICPNPIKQQWHDAIEEVDPYAPVCIFSSQRKDITNYFFSKNKHGGAFIINYESIKAFYDDGGWNKFNPLRTYLVADESTKIADPDAKMTKGALELAAICRYTRVLTGKPSKGSNADLWAQLKFIGSTSRNFTQHKHMFTILGGWQGRQSIKNVNTELLKKEMEPFCFIADDKYVKGFKKIYEPLEKVIMLGNQLRIYEQMEKELLVEITSDLKMTAPIILVKYLRLQQISSGIGGDSEGNHFNILPPEDNPRIRSLKRILSTIGDYDDESDSIKLNSKVIIVCRFRLSIENIKKELEKDDHKVAIMHGGMGAELDRQKELFHKGDHDILVAQLQVLNFGHTLHGPDNKPCLDVIYYENDFSLINRAQTESRPEKFGREEPIHYHDFYASRMDRTMVQTLIRKEDASMALMGYAREMGILNNQESNSR